MNAVETDRRGGGYGFLGNLENLLNAGPCQSVSQRLPGNRNGFEAPVAFWHRLCDGIPFSTHSQIVTGILHIAACQRHGQKKKKRTFQSLKGMSVYFFWPAQLLTMIWQPCLGVQRCWHKWCNNKFILRNGIGFSQQIQTSPGEDIMSQIKTKHLLWVLLSNGCHLNRLLIINREKTQIRLLYNLLYNFCDAIWKGNLNRWIKLCYFYVPRVWLFHKRLKTDLTHLQVRQYCSFHDVTGVSVVHVRKKNFLLDWRNSI